MKYILIGVLLFSIMIVSGCSSNRQFFSNISNFPEEEISSTIPSIATNLTAIPGGEDIPLNSGIANSDRVAPSGTSSSGSNGVWAPALYTVEVIKNGLATIFTNCCGASVDGGEGYLKTGETRYAIYNNGASSDYVDVYFIKGPEEDFPSPVVDIEDIIISDQGEFRIDYFKLARVKRGQVIILNGSLEDIRIKYLAPAGESK